MELEDSLASMQHAVGGLIQAVYEPGGRNAALICNEEGKLLGLPLNRTLRDENGEIYDAIAGTLVSFGRGEASYSPSASLATTEKVAPYTHKNNMQSDPLNKHLVLNTGHPFSVLVRSAGQEHLEGDKSYKKYMHGHFTPGGFCP